VHACWPVEQSATVGERRPIGDSAALTAPCQMPPARAGDAADQHPPRPQRVAARATQWWPDNPQRPGEAAVDVRHAVCACRAEAPVLDAYDAGGQGAWPGRNLHRYAVNRAMRSVDDG
jgi:hypothetical protein